MMLWKQSVLLLDLMNLTVIESTTGNNVYSQLLDYRLLRKSYGFSSGSFSFANLVPANATTIKASRFLFDILKK